MRFHELLGFTRPDWHADAACLEHPAVDFYNVRQTDEARAICARCLVQQECLDHALEHGEQGVWGATDEAERREIREAA